MQRCVAFLSVLALVLVIVGVSPATAPRHAIAATPVASVATPIPITLPSAATLGLNFPIGIEVTPLAVAVIDQLPADATLLRLERVTVPAGEERAPRTPAVSELLFAELGTVTIVDVY